LSASGSLRARLRFVGTPRAAAWAFGIYVAIALPLLLWIGSYRWFLGDEWAFLADRSVNLHDAFRPHNQHWSTFPLLAYRGLYSLVGLRAYWPFQLLVVVLHLTAAVLLRLAMRRAEVRPWIATVVAATFVLFGPGEDNILWAFQIGFAGALVLGLTQLMLADHDGPIDRRDWLGLLAGLACLMTSGQAIGMIIATGLVCLIHRRVTAALFHTAPLAGVYLVWWVIEDVPTVLGGFDRPFTFGTYVTWMSDAVEALFSALGYFTIIALLLAAVLVVGLVLACRDAGVDQFLRRAAVPVALLAAAVLAMSIAAPSRFAIGEGGAKASRYVGVMAAMTLPALAVAADAISKRWRVLTPVVVALFLVPVPFNAVGFGDSTVLTPATYTANRDYVAALAKSPLIDQVPAWVRPNQTLTGIPGVTVGWLREAARRGELPSDTNALHPLIAQLIPLQLGIGIVDGASPDGLECETFTEPLALDPEVGDRWYFASDVQAALRTGPDQTSLWTSYQPTGVEITLPDLRLVLAPVAGASTFELCR
jgi:hypothetical protein